MHAAHRHGAWIITLTAMVLNLVHLGTHHDLSSPPEIGDGVDYDSIGLNLARGRGFGIFPGDPEWRAPYEAALAEGRDDYAALMQDDSGFQRTTYRPPLLPILLAGIYSTVGRHFIVWRILGCLIAALAAGLTFRLAVKLGGATAGWIAGLLFLIDPYQRHLAGLYLTESMAVLLLVLFTLVLMQVVERPTLGRFAALGVLLSLALLTRGIFIFLLPLAVLVAVGAAWVSRREKGVQGLALFVLAAGVLVAPWWIRNCVALDAFMPFGAQGWINMPAAYNDLAIKNGGNWDGNIRDEIFRESGLDTSPGTTRLEAERIRADAGRELTMRWIRNNPEKLPRLFITKVMTLWGSSRLGIATLGVAALGIIFSRPLRNRAPVYAVLAVYTIGVGLTWTTEGRFRVPVMPLVFALCSDAIVALGSRFGSGQAPGTTKDRG